MKPLLAASAASLLITSPAAASEHRAGDIVVTGERPTGDTAQAAADIERTPGGVEVVPDTAFKCAPVQNIIPKSSIPASGGPSMAASATGSEAP